MTQSAHDKSERLRHIRHRAYAKARAYWSSAGDTTKAAMTDAELDEHFAHFDVYGIPRLKSDSDDVPPEPGTLRYAAQVAQRAALRSNNPQLARDARLIMDTHFPDRDAAAAPATADDAAAE